MDHKARLAAVEADPSTLETHLREEAAAGGFGPGLLALIQALIAAAKNNPALMATLMALLQKWLGGGTTTP